MRPCRLSMSEPRLEGSGIVAGVRQSEAAGVPEHVRVDRKRTTLRLLTRSCDPCTISSDSRVFGKPK